MSRGIPAFLRFIIDPIVRNVSRKVLFLAVQQTRQAVANPKIIDKNVVTETRP